ncbi:unnamed protein product [Pseudo-nitzschia multistriata]|uniref:RING-type domain-containing protein n=1 Tax=Pseudo-nitzschia multistriata TaxID=183589 RepID=A0A448YV86_9STRA|nr:unnamed protein product [Pseudo-nitzschia multistriata]
MEEILKLSIPLLRNENWRTRDAIHRHCSTTQKKILLWKHVAEDEDLKSCYYELLKIFRSCDVWRNVHLSTGFEDAEISHEEEHVREPNEAIGMYNPDGIGMIRHNPEIMVRIYGYLSLGDRIYKLSLVDRAFSRDEIRSGIASATYGKGFNLHQALLELRLWALEERQSDNIGEELELASPSGTGIAYQGPTLKRKRDDDFHTERISKISRMLEAAKVTDKEPLLYVRSNLKNTLVTPGKREQWMAQHIQEFLRNENCKLRGHCHQRIQSQSWWMDIVRVETFLRRYFFDGRVNRLEQLMQDVGFQNDYERYKRSQFLSSNKIFDHEKLIWCLPDLSPGCILLLPGLEDDQAGDAAGNVGCWREHRFMSCGLCEKLGEHDKSIVVRCRHGHQRSFCKNCYHSLLDCPGDSNDDTTSGIPVLDPVHMFSPKLRSRSMICVHCLHIARS